MDVRPLARRKRRPIILRWFLSYLLIIMIPLATGLGIYARAQKTLVNELIDTHQLFLQQLRTAIDTRFAEIDSLLFQIQNTNTVTSLALAQTPMSNEQIYDVFELMKALRIYKTSNEFIDEVSIYYPRIGCIVNSNGKYDMQTYYLSYVSGSSIAYSAWLESLTQMSQHKLVTDWDLVYLSNPKNSSAKPSNIIFLHLNKDLLKTYFAEYSNIKGSSILVTTAQDDVIFMEGESTDRLLQLLHEDWTVTDASSNGMIFTHMVSEINGWHYSFLTPYDHVTEKSQYIIRYTVLMTGIALVCSIIAAMLMSYFQYRPLQQLMSHVRHQREWDSNESEYQLLERHITGLASDNVNMEGRLNQQGLLLGLENLRRLLLGQNYASESELEILQDYGIVFGGSYFCVAKVACSPRDMNSAAFIRQVDTLFKETFSSENVYTLRIMDTICCVINSAKEYSPSEMQPLFENIWQRLAQDLDGALWISISLSHKELLTLPAAYAESTRAMEQRTMEEDGGLVYYDAEKQNASFGGIYYPNGFDTRLIHVLCGGELAQIADCLEEIIEQNLRRSITARQCTYLGYHMCMSFLKAIRECQSLYHIDLTKLMETLIQSIQIDQISHLRKHYLEASAILCEKIASADQDHTETLIDRIKTCVADHYQNPDLNVNTLAGMLSMNASYISRTFAEKTGETLSSYMQKIRINEAMVLLEGNLSVADVMPSVGYANITTFTRAFKKEVGMTPGQYRELKRKKR